jgi:hypothetical protein
MNMNIIKTKSVLRSWGLACAVFLTAGCSTLPMEEYAQFTPAPVGQRIMTKSRSGKFVMMWRIFVPKPRGWAKSKHS